MYRRRGYECQTFFLVMMKSMLNRLIRTANGLPVFMMLVACFSTRSYAQQDMAAQLARQLTTYGEQHFQEKVFVHTDKSFYVAGEIIWFSLYNTDGYLNRLTSLSKVAYVELLTQDHQPVLQAKIELEGGRGSGSFMLPFSIASGTYIFRAYTNWMKNFSPEFFFEKPIPIVNTLKKSGVNIVAQEPVSVHFYPESGNLVEGLRSKVAFQAVDHSGKGVACKGVIIAEDKDTVLSFQSGKSGIGHFYFTPDAGRKYKALIKSGNFSRETQLPTAYQSGYTFELIRVNDRLVQVNVRAKGHNSEAVYLLAHTRQVVRYAATTSLSGGEAAFRIQTDSLGEGISHFMLFNANRQPVCERLFFRAPVSQLDLAVSTMDSNYTLRKKVTVQIRSTQNDEQSDAHLSVAVFNVDSLQRVDEDNIRTYLWLTSELKGWIESPALYFNHDTAAMNAADDLMLTQGWSRFRWEDVAATAGPGFRYLPEYEGMLIHANMDVAGTQSLRGKKAYLSIPGQHFTFKPGTSDENGRIIFNTGKFYGKTDLILQSRDIAGVGKSFRVQSPFTTAFSSRSFSPIRISPGNMAELAAHHVATQVENSFARDKKLVFYLPESTDTTAFFGKPDKTYMLDDYTRFITMEEVMREYVAEVRVRKTDNRFYFRVRNKPVNDFFDRDPLILLDGLPVMDLNTLMEFDPLKIKRIDLLTRKYFAGSEAIDGIVSFNTFKGNLDGFTLDPGAIVIDYPGLQMQREFYSPVYDTEALLKSPLPDFRNLLYWAPALTTTKGNGSIDFYTSDRPGKYAIFVQGIANNGTAGSQVVYFDVHK